MVLAELVPLVARAVAPLVFVFRGGINEAELLRRCDAELSCIDWFLESLRCGGTFSGVHFLSVPDPSEDPWEDTVVSRLSSGVFNFRRTTDTLQP